MVYIRPLKSGWDVTDLTDASNTFSSVEWTGGFHCKMHGIQHLVYCRYNSPLVRMGASTCSWEKIVSCYVGPTEGGKKSKFGNSFITISQINAEDIGSSTYHHHQIHPILQFSLPHYAPFSPGSTPLPHSILPAPSYFSGWFTCSGR